MTDNSLKWRPALAIAAVAAGLIVASCEAPRPEPLAPRTTGEKAKPNVLPEDGALYESQVEKPVALATGSPAPRYPDILRQAGVSGEALVSFAVNANGTADTASFKVIRTTHELFATAVKKVLPEMRFTPAEAGGRKVKQLVEQPFTFTIVGSKQPSADTSAAPGTLDEIAISAVPPRKGVAVIRRRNEEVPATSITVVVYSNDGREVGRGENLLQALDPQSIQSIEVWKPSRCPSNVTCPLIKIVLEKGKTLGGSPPIRPRRRDATIADGQESRVEYPVASTMNVELLTSSGEVIARWPNRPGPGTINSEDITASEAYYGKYCKAGSPCPLTRIWLKPGREVAYKRG